MKVILVETSEAASRLLKAQVVYLIASIEMQLIAIGAGKGYLFFAAEEPKSLKPADFSQMMKHLRKQESVRRCCDAVRKSPIQSGEQQSVVLWDLPVSVRQEVIADPQTVGFCAIKNREMTQEQRAKLGGGVKGDVACLLMPQARFGQYKTQYQEGLADARSVEWSLK